MQCARYARLLHKKTKIRAVTELRASQFMEGHNEWIKRGFDDGIFLLVGSLQPNLGGGIVAHNTSLSELQSRVNDDPFVAENVVCVEIIEITPSKTDERLTFLLG